MKLSEKEVELGIGLIERLTSEEFNPENYKDEYRIRVLGMLGESEKKILVKNGKVLAHPSVRTSSVWYLSARGGKKQKATCAVRDCAG